MIRTTITPLNTDMHITIPQEYVGKQIELLMYSIEEGKQKTESNDSTLFNLLSNAPEMKDEEYKLFIEKQKHFNQWK
jgi:hypothetical protein